MAQEGGQPALGPVLPSLWQVPSSALVSRGPSIKASSSRETQTSSAVPRWARLGTHIFP